MPLSFSVFIFTASFDVVVAVAPATTVVVILLENSLCNTCVNFPKINGILCCVIIDTEIFFSS